MVQINPSAAFRRHVDSEITVAFRKVFCRLAPEEELFLLRGSVQHIYSAGEIIVEQGQPFSGIYVIVEGTARVELDGPTGKIDIAELGRGDIFGEMSFVDDEPTSASVIAEGPVELLLIEENVIQSLLLGDPTFGHRFYHSIAITLAQRLRKTNPKVAALAPQAH
ncbi:MAG: cyclic nucleotide-binding domain-containing protein [Magnetovibrio sp.]|nr:cyclic nucleotide-binding domain-containing protein [Magnetovibrio sp.]